LPAFSRRDWLKGAGVLTASAYPHLGLASEKTLPDLIPGKSALRLLNDRPLNAETPAHLLDETTTSTTNLFVRNNGNPPVNVSATDWRVSVSGESCIEPQYFSVFDLKNTFKSYSYDLQLECGGNGRGEFRPRASGNQWSTGAVACPRWTGVRVADVLNFCGIAPDAEYLGFKAADTHLSGDPAKSVISRGVPMFKALEPESLIAYQLNGEDIPLLHGAPLRLVCGGWPGSVSGKWLTELPVRNRVHDGAKMGGTSYRVPCEPVAPGSKVADESMCIIQSMPVKSLITSPRSGVSVPLGEKLRIRGHAWAGDLAVSDVRVSIDFGATWQPAELAKPRNRLAWQDWQAQVTLPKSGYFEVWAHATDELGRGQPMLVPGWNPKGYLNNAAHRIAVHAN
jgi:DMSO/TMAO reductase YedYZ molybdopterin-dependent catalytic subunit